MFIHIPEPRPREGIAPTLELQIRARLDNASAEHVGEAVTISSPQYETFIAQCTEALQRDKSIDLEVAPASAGDTETITIVNDSGITVEDMRETLSDLIGDIPSIGVTISVNDGQYTITLTTVPDLPVLETHVETLTWSADGHTLTPTIHTTTGTEIPAWTPAVLEQTEAYPGGTIRYVDTTYGPIPCTPQGTVIIDAAIATSIHHARV
jgi:hypothetical protein